MAKKTSEVGIDLEKELAKETEYIHDQPEVEEEEEPAPDDLDLDEELPDEEEPVEDDTPSRDSLQKMAMRWVKAFNAVQKMALRPVYRKTILQPGDHESAEEALKAYKENPGVRVEEVFQGDKGTMRRIEKFLDAMNELPFTDDEMESLADPLAEVIEKHRSLRMSPEAALVLSLLIVMLPRIEPVIPGLAKALKKAVNKDASE